MNRQQVRDIVSQNLNDTGVSFYQAQDINFSYQDAYYIITILSQCLVKSVTLNWLNGVTYYDFLTGNNGANTTVPDFLGVTAIFNNNTNQWLRDDVSLRDFDRLRIDWELWRGTPQFWAPHSLKYIATAPCYQQASGTFTLWYWAFASVIIDDVTEPLVSADMQDLFEFFLMGDLLESAEEGMKAGLWWPRFFQKLQEYKERCRVMCRADLVPRL